MTVIWYREISFGLGKSFGRELIDNGLETPIRLEYLRYRRIANGECVYVLPDIRDIDYLERGVIMHKDWYRDRLKGTEGNIRKDL